MKYRKTIIKTALATLCFFAIAYVGAWKGKYYSSAVSFFPINGDFQNYNVFRRFLSGQTPYVDFSNYLGLGVLYVNSATLSLFGSTFADSYALTRAIALVSFAFTVGSFFYCFTVDLKASIGFACITTAFFSNVPYWCSYLPSSICSAIQNNGFISIFTTLIEPGNSFRGLRGGVFFIELAVFCFILTNEKCKNWFVQLKAPLQGLLIGFIAGCFVPWSNDWGIACYISAAFVFFLSLCKSTDLKGILGGTVSYILSSLCGLLVISSFATKGHPSAWFRFTLGVSSWQKPYYGTNLHDKIVSLNQLPPFGEQKPIFRFVTLVLLLFFFVSVLVLICKKSNFKRTLQVYLSSSLIVYSYLYWVGSSYDDEVLYISVLALFIGFISTVYNLLKKQTEKSSMKTIKLGFDVFVVVCGVLGAFACFIAGNTYKRSFGIQSPISANLYIEELGGNIGSYHDDILLAVDKLQGKSLFSTYASAVECVRNEFQPSGSDYIIHALGDEYRENYISSFIHSDPDVVSFINRTFTVWEGWATFENWDFYRLVLPDYSFFFDTAYASYYHKDSPNVNVVDTNVDVTVERISASEVEIHVVLDTCLEHGIADVKLSYSSYQTKLDLTRLPLGKIVFATGSGTYVFANRFDGFFLPADIDEKYIPIEIIDGAGYVRLKMEPDGVFAFESIDVSVIQILQYSQIDRFYSQQ